MKAGLVPLDGVQVMSQQLLRDQDGEGARLVATREFFELVIHCQSLSIQLDSVIKWT